MDFAKRNIILIMFAVLPFGFLSHGIAYEGQYLALLIAFAAILAGTIRNNWITAFFWYLCCWILFICIYRLFYVLPGQVFGAALDQFLFLTAGLVVYSVAANIKTIKLGTYYNVICGAALVQAAISLGQFSGFDLVTLVLSRAFHTERQLNVNALTGTLFNNNFLTAYLAISLPFFFRKNWFYGLILLIPCLVLGNSTAAVIPAIIGTIYYLWNQRNLMGTGYNDAARAINNIFKTIIYLFFAILIIGGLYYALVYHPSLINFTSPDSRWVFWTGAIKKIFYSPYTVIFGYGPGNGWGYSFPMHNEWLQCWYGYGLIGLSLLTGYVLTVFRGNRMLFTAILIAAINMTGNYSLHLAPSAFLICMIAGLIEREKMEAIRAA